jgi:hypothetical protein
MVIFEIGVELRTGELSVSAVSSAAINYGVVATVAVAAAEVFRHSRREFSLGRLGTLAISYKPVVASSQPRRLW